MSEKKFLVSILILTMNHEKFIEQACISALEQTYQNLEIILLDNTSSDTTYEKALATLNKGSRTFQIYKNEMSFGVAKNLNFLLSKAKGEYIGILSGDDWWAENMISEKVDFVEKNNCDFVLSDGFKFIQETGEFTEAYSMKTKERIKTTLEIFFHENVTENKTVNVGTFVRRSILEKYPFDENIQTEDWDMNLRLTHLGYKIGFIDQKLFYYRVLSGSLSRRWKVMEDSYKKVTEKYLDYIMKDKELKKNYLLNLLHYQYEILLAETHDKKTRKQLQKSWKREKYQLKYTQPVLFLKNLLLHWS